MKKALIYSLITITFLGMNVSLRGQLVDCGVGVTSGTILCPSPYHPGNGNTGPWGGWR